MESFFTPRGLRRRSRHPVESHLSDLQHFEDSPDPYGNVPYANVPDTRVTAQVPDMPHPTPMEEDSEDQYRC